MPPGAADRPGLLGISGISAYPEKGRQAGGKGTLMLGEHVISPRRRRAALAALAALALATGLLSVPLAAAADTPAPTPLPTETSSPAPAATPTPAPDETDPAAPETVDPPAEEVPDAPAIDAAQADEARARSAAVARASASDFDAGELISDPVFYNENSMTAGQIQSFLESKVRRSACDVSACLRDYKATTKTRSDNTYCSKFTSTGTKELASTIIYKVAQACDINPQVLIVLVQKEQGLVTATEPGDLAFKYATGYACPDTPQGCDKNYSGFFNQLWLAAGRMLYVAERQDTRFLAGEKVKIDYQVPGPKCGTKSVRIKNKATSALYAYTPYTPNNAALSNMYGEGDKCSAYGNRNFWRDFTDWFGATSVPTGSEEFVFAAYADVLGREPSDADVEYWSAQLAAGASRGVLGSAFNNSDEYRLLRIDAAYREVLDRDPESSGRAYWLNQMRAGGLSPDSAYSFFMTTDEYVRNAGGTPTGYVTAVYRQIIERDPEPDGIAYWSGILRTKGRSAVVYTIWNARETTKVRVNDAFVTFLGRPASESEKESHATYELRYGHTAMRSRLMASSEYLDRALLRF